MYTPRFMHTQQRHIFAAGFVCLLTACGDATIAEAEARDENQQEARAAQADERLQALEDRMNEAVDNGTLDAAAADARTEWARIKTHGSEEAKAEMDAIIQPFNEEKKRIRAGVAAGTITEDDGQEQLRVLHVAFGDKLKAIATEDD